MFRPTFARTCKPLHTRTYKRVTERVRSRTYKRVDTYKRITTDACNPLRPPHEDLQAITVRTYKG